MTGIARRSFCLGAVAAGVTSVSPGTVSGSVWQGNGWTRRGINILQPFGWVVTENDAYAPRPYVNGGEFSAIMPAERRAAIRNIGFDFVRMTVDFGPLLSAVDAARLDRLIADIRKGIDLYLESGLAVVVVAFAPADAKAWPTVLDGIAGRAFQRFVAVWERFAGVLAAYTDPERVAIEPYNEPPFPKEIAPDPWLKLQKHLFYRMRAALPKHTLVVTGDSFSAADRLTTLDPADYDDNTLFKFCGYEPLVISHQGHGYWKYIHRLSFPPQLHPGGKRQAISDFIAAVNADDTISSYEKFKTIRKFTSSRAGEGIDTYFDTPCDAGFIAGRVRLVTDWAARHGISSQRLVVGEFGARGDYSITAPDGSSVVTKAGEPATQARLCEAWRLQIEAGQLGAWCAHEINGPAGFNLALGEPPWTFRADLVAALGLNR